MKKAILLVGLVGLMSCPVWAQNDYPRVELFGGFSLAGGRTVLGVVVAPGWQGTAHLNFTKRFGVNADFAGQYRSGIQFH